MRTLAIVHILPAFCVQRILALCTGPLLIDDFQGWITKTNELNSFVSDDGTMSSISATNGILSFVPKDASYLYETLPCSSYLNNGYNRIQFAIDAPAGATFNLEIQTKASCEDTSYTSEEIVFGSFPGGTQLLSIPLSSYTESNPNAITSFVWGTFSNTTATWKLSGVNFACNATTSRASGGSSSVAKPPSFSLGLLNNLSSASSASATTSVSATASKPISISVKAQAAPTPSLIDTFASSSTNAAGHWHGADDGMSLTWGSKSLTIRSSDADFSFYSQFSDTCVSLAAYASAYLHIAYSGTTAFTVALQQHNAACSEDIVPFPETWDSVEASRYSNGTDIYIPLSHFNMNMTRVIGVALKGFYHPTDSLKLTRIELLPTIPPSFPIPPKLPTGSLLFHCRRPNSFAFGIDDGEPEYAQTVLQILAEENVTVTFFTVGQALLDPSTNLSNVYRDAAARGHQIALHSFTHPKMEGLPSTAAIDAEYVSDLAAMASTFPDLPKSTYFRPPYGTEGARMRERLAAVLGVEDPSVVMWSVDVEDWLWGESGTPEKQLDAFRRDVGKGGDLVVMHYLYASTVGYLREFIREAKATGKRLMRVDQCMMDPGAPPLD
ncbi:glycoside hydrolase/deacetylase [Lophium mytilinum]|uniref:Glycoside hydrolase/deacetylase n=1 Tax=Lophium mytilinum TaxID=390894 RepID=A0A6A6RBZ1_9PEZI|nr:glycoside hydrolase/deacetylase [Lophium mytilinum]